MNISLKARLGRSFLLRAKHNSDIIQFITEFAEKNEIVAATFTAIGALKSAKLGFYDQEKHKYSERTLSTPQEIASCIGNISLKEAKPFTHAHAVLSDQNGNIHGGHFLKGKVFAVEIHLIELPGTKAIRKNDAATGLSLWISE